MRGDLTEVASIGKVVLKREQGVTQIPWWGRGGLTGRDDHL
jgi:hypothetical protein